MKRKVLFTFLFIIFTFFVAGCMPEKKVKDYIIDLSHLPENVNLYNFHLEDIKLNVIYSNSTADTVDLNEDMLKEVDVAKLLSVGEHHIEVNYADIVKTFDIVINELRYKIVFLDIDGNILDEQMVVAGENAVVPDYDILEDYNFIGLSSNKHRNVCEDAIISPIYEQTICTVKFIVNGELIEERKVDRGTELIDLPTLPYLDGYLGKWDIEEDHIVNENIEINASYIVENNYEQIEEAKNYILQKYSNIEIKADLDLENRIDYCTIEWESNSEYLSNDGKFTKPYKDLSVTLTFTITCGSVTVTNTLDLKLKGYKDLSENIASAYVYREYYNLTDKFFETMDIIYCAFISFNSDGSLAKNSSVLGNIKKYVIPKASEYGVYKVLSLGGGGESPRSAYVSVTQNESTRKILIDNVINLINEYGFDGVDIDWETPTSSQAPYFTLFVKELSEAIKKNNPNHILTAAITGGRWQPPRYDLVNSGKYLDYINVMTYGMSSSGGTYQNALYFRSGYNDSINRVGSVLSSCSIDESVDIFNGYNIPNNKLIFGLAFYGVKQVKSKGSWSGGGSVYYTSIKNNYLNNDDYEYFYDEKAQVPYILSKDKTVFISYDDPRSIIAKCKYVKDTKCAGVMYWENGCDSTGDLVNAIYDGLKK